ncbi:MAG: hypothetical protein ACTMIA_13760 [Vibrio sp.]
MRQGMLYTILFTLVLFTSSSWAVIISNQARQEVLNDETLQQKVEDLYQLGISNRINALDFSIERLALPQQDAARYLLFRRFEKSGIALSASLYGFVQKQNLHSPTYKLMEYGQGYEFSVPAFNYPAIGFRLMNRWDQDQKTVDFILHAELHELDLKTWLSGPKKGEHEQLLLRELDNLSVSAIGFLTKQLTSTNVTSWLPSSRVMVKLARISRDPKVYKLLWLMRSDHIIEDELARLATHQDKFALSQLMLAARNPKLTSEAIKALVSIHPMDANVETFLVQRLSNSDEASLTARALVNYGHRHWLEDLMHSNRQIKTRLIMQTLSAL